MLPRPLLVLKLGEMGPLEEDSAEARLVQSQVYRGELSRDGDIAPVLVC